MTAGADRLNSQLSYYPASFYQNVENGEVDDALKRDLFSVLNSAHNPTTGGHDTLSATCSSSDCYKQKILGYKPARTILFGDLHLQKDGGAYAIRDVYCQHLSTAAEYTQDPPSPGAIPDPAVINVEHTWPQSKFTPRFPAEMQKSDLHILYPAMANANTSRSNHPFSEVVTVLSTPCAPARRGYTTSGSTVYFEPPDVHKGNTARAIFYFAVRYKLSVGAVEEASLRAWHRSDPPDRFEIERNEKIFAKQKVRNPFIDHPELVDLIHDF